MDRKDVDKMVYEIYTNCQRVAPLSSEEDTKMYWVIELTRMVFMETASVPEFNLARDLIELFIKNKVEVTAGFFSDEEYNDLSDKERAEFGLEMFVNPKDLFFGGKVRPDIVFRKGKGNYIVIEVDSFMHHSNQEQLLKDKVRERKIQSLGYPVFRFAAKECLDGKTWETACEVYTTLKERKFI